MVQNRNLRQDLLAVGILAALAYLLIALVTFNRADPVLELAAPLDQIYRPNPTIFPLNDKPTNACGRFGALVADVMYSTFGFGSFYVLVGLAVLAVALLIRGQLNSIGVRALGWTMSLVGITAMIHRFLYAGGQGPIVGPGGYLGALSSGLLQSSFGPGGSLIIMATLTLIGTMFWTDYFVFRLLRLALAPVLFGASRARSGIPFRQATPAASGGTQRQNTKANTVRDDLEAIPVRSAALRDDLTSSNQGSAKAARTAKHSLLKADIAEEDLEDIDAELELDDDGEASDGADDETTNSTKPAAPNALDLSSKKAPLAQRSKPADERQQVIRALNKATLNEQPTAFELPEIEMLDQPSTINFDEQRADALRKARILEKTFHQFGFNVKVVDIETGPVIAQYELELEAGLRLAKITNLSDDLAIALRVPAVRIVAPIPGKNTVGIEVPNESRQVVRLREVMERGSAKSAKMKIPLFLGQDVRGEPLVVDLATLPHLMIAGRTGTGKSVCLNAIIASMLMTRRPDEVRMLMIDPKMVELSGYARLPHLMHPVVTDMRKAEAILAWAVDKMEERYALLARAGVRHITSYNQLGEQELIQRLQPETDEERQGIPLSLPFIVIVADEMADLMMTAGKEVQQHIIRLAQKSRAVGIHLILATQKPTVDVITGLIKSNLPARIAFQVATRTDSQVVLDCNGAERLLGNGDMLFLWPGTSTLLRGQGTYLTDDEINSITNAVSTGEQNFVHELVNMRVADPNEEEATATLKNRDEVYQQAVEVVIREGRGSVSLLQRALGIGYGRAARLIDFMEQDGVVGAYAGAKSREVIMSMAQWQQLQMSANSSAADSAPSAKTPLSPLVARTTMQARVASDNRSSDEDFPEDELEDGETEDQDEHELDNDWEDADDDDAENAADDEDEDDDEFEDEHEERDDHESGDGVREDTRLPIRLSKPPNFGLKRPKRSANDEDGKGR